MPRMLRPLVALLALAALLVACGPPADVNYLPTTAPSAAPAAAPPLATIAPDPASAPMSPLLALSEETMSVKGDPAAPLLIIEFSDYECPFCNRYVSETLPQIQAQYIDTGKVRYMFRDFPLNTIHPQAQLAAEAARCAGEQAKYWEMHDQLFARQGEWQGTAARTVFSTMAMQLGLDSGAFSQCLGAGRYTAYVQQQTEEGTRIGLSGTPSFFIGDQFLAGAQSFEAFQRVIEQQLAAR